MSSLRSFTGDARVFNYASHLCLDSLLLLAICIIWCRENLFEEMLQEPDEIAVKRKRTQETLHVLQQAYRVCSQPVHTNVILPHSVQQKFLFSPEYLELCFSQENSD